MSLPCARKSSPHATNANGMVRTRETERTMNTHEQAWRTLESDLELQIDGLETDFATAAAALARYASCIREPGDTLTVATVASYATRLADIQARLAQRQSMLSRMRATIKPTAEAAS